MKKLDAYGLRIALVIMSFMGIEYACRSIDHIFAWVWTSFNLPVSRVSLEVHLWFVEYVPFVMWGIYAIFFIQLLKWKQVYS